jgi:hypothetical protein
MRSIPTKTVEHCRSVHDVRHQSAMRHSTGEGDLYKQLQRLAREREMLEQRLVIWLSQKERTEAQIAVVEREEARILEALEPQIHEEAAEGRTAPSPLQPIPSRRRRGAV